MRLLFVSSEVNMFVSDMHVRRPLCDQILKGNTKTNYAEL